MDKHNLFLNDGYGGLEMQGNDLQNCFFNPNWDNHNNSIATTTIDQNCDPFESALSSMVSSPVTSHNPMPKNSDNFVLRELIGRLGSICNSGGGGGEMSPPNSNYIAINGSNNHSTNTSCYSTPLNSPPKLNLFGTNSTSTTSLAQFPSSDPGFAERAARFSCFANKTFSNSFNNEQNRQVAGVTNLESGKLSRVSSNHSIKIQELENNSRENSSVSEQIPTVQQNDSNSRKRKSISKGKATKNATTTNVSTEKNESSAKKSKSEENNGDDKVKEEEKETKDNQKPPEAPKDYIHVRARRGQATDAHSLAERVRREKISERMKLLQDLVPGCNKVTGKAVMLDEIINYVQSLQRQVEFLSMKLATVNPRMDLNNMEALLSKDMYQSRGSLAHNMYPSENSAQAFPYGFPGQNFHKGTEIPFPLNPNLGRNQNMQLPSLDGYVDPTPQVPSFFEDDLHSVVQMGFGQNQNPSFPGNNPTSQMKLEL